MIGFYPACGRDVEETAAILAPFVDRILFCDNNRRLVPYWNRLKRTLPEIPAVEFKCCDARAALVDVPQIDVAFHRRDSPGEGGSALSILKGRLAATILGRFPAEGGLLITDGSNVWGEEFERLTRARGAPIHLADGRAEIGELGHMRPPHARGAENQRWWLRPAPDQPLLYPHGLWVIAAKKEA